MNKVTKTNCSFFFLFKLGLSFVKKRTGERTLRTKVPRYICWLPPGMMVLGVADCKNCPQSHSAASYYAPCRNLCKRMPTSTITFLPLAPHPHLLIPQCSSQLLSKGRGEQAALALSKGWDPSPLHTGELEQPCARANSSLSDRAWTHLGSQGKSIDVDRSFFQNPKGQPWAA